MYIIVYYFKSTFTDDFCGSSPSPLWLHKVHWRDTVVPRLQRRYLGVWPKAPTLRPCCWRVGELPLSFSHWSADSFLLSVSTPIKESVRPSPDLWSQETKGGGKPLLLVLTSKKKNDQAGGQALCQLGKKWWGEELETKEKLALIFKLCCILESSGKFSKVSLPSNHQMLIKSDSLKVELGIGTF